MSGKIFRYDSWVKGKKFDGNNPGQVEPQWHSGLGRVGRIQRRLKGL